MMSSSERLATAFFMTAALVPALDPFCNHISCRATYTGAHPAILVPTPPSGNRAHSTVRLAGPRLAIIHLPHQVLGGKTREIGGLRMSLSRHQMARTARHLGGPALSGHDPWRRTVFPRKPIGWRRVTRDL